MGLFCVSVGVVAPHFRVEISQAFPKLQYCPSLWQLRTMACALRLSHALTHLGTHLTCHLGCLAAAMLPILWQLRAMACARRLSHPLTHLGAQRRRHCAQLSEEGAVLQLRGGMPGGKWDANDAGCAAACRQSLNIAIKKQRVLRQQG